LGYKVTNGFKLSLHLRAAALLNMNYINARRSLPCGHETLHYLFTLCLCHLDDFWLQGSRLWLSYVL